MKVKERHIQLFNTSFKLFFGLKRLNMLPLVLVFLFIFTTSFAAEQTAIVYKASNENKIIITEGRITATEGNNIRLLPGTHIKAGDQLIVDITNKSQQEALADKLAEENEKAMLATMAKQRENLLLPDVEEEIPTIVYQSNLPIPNAQIGQQHVQLTASLVNTNYSFNTPISSLHKNNTRFNIQNFPVLAKQSQFTPLSSWGDCAETIKVMRC